MKNKLTKEFLIAVNEIEPVLESLHFHQYSFEEKGFGYFVKYKRNNTYVEFLFGPSDWNIELIIFTINGKYTFKDLLQISNIKKWVDNNRYIQEDERNLKKEMLWFIELLKFSLPIIE